MVKKEFQTRVAEIPAARQENQPYLKWVDESARRLSVAGALHVKLDKQLREEFGYQGDLTKPNHNDPEKIYLVKAASAYLEDCIRYHQQHNDSFNPEDGIGTWLNTKGKLWMINDSLTQTLTKALQHGYTHASEEAEGRPRIGDCELIRKSISGPACTNP